MLTFTDIVISIQLLFQVIGILILLFAGIITVVQYFFHQPWNNDSETLKAIETSRVALGQKIVFGLEFFIISDAITTVMKPTIEELYRVALIVAIRTALSFFISRELHILHRKKA